MFPMFNKIITAIIILAIFGFGACTCGSDEKTETPTENAEMAVPQESAPEQQNGIAPGDLPPPDAQEMPPGEGLPPGEPPAEE